MPPAPSVVPGASERPPTVTSRLAVASCVCGALSLTAWLLGSVPGLACGILALDRIARSRAGPGPRLGGRGAAITGIILSAIGLVARPTVQWLVASRPG